MSVVDQVKAEKNNIIKEYTNRSNTKAAIQCLNTLVPYFALFYLALTTLSASVWLSALYMLPLSFFTVRIFMIMHDCGHKCLFRTQHLNTIFGFITGVIVGMPQYVWSQHHNFHHSTNGNWEKYRGPLDILSVDEYEQLSPAAQMRYRYGRNIFLAPVGAFMYFIFSPRFNWMLGSLIFITDVTKFKMRNMRTPLKKIITNQESRYWSSGRQYLHMILNNIVLLSIWVAASWHFGTSTFFTVYVISLSFAGAAGIIIFTIQHNFEASYASDDKHWDYYQAAMKGTSFLTLPSVINWFGLDIAYHHIHHISAKIPNYNLARCHRQYEHLFTGVTRIRLQDIAKAFKFILWHRKGQKIISIDQYNKMIAAA